MRVTNAPARRRRHKAVLSRTKSFRWGRKNLYRLAKNADVKAGQNAYRDRRRKKRDFRQLWITRISAALKLQGKRYSEFIRLSADKHVALNRKSLSEVAVQHPAVFSQIVDQVYS